MTDSELQPATVVAAYGRRTALRLANGAEVNARIKGRKLQAVCGDRVQARPIENEPDWLIESVDHRKNALTRPNLRGKAEILAANLDLLVAVCADQPAPDWFIVDRYLCAAELMRIAGAVVFNKVDAGSAPPHVVDELDQYAETGYPVAACSARTGNNLEAFTKIVSGNEAIIVGQSGVGKSSLINALTQSEQRTAEISVTRREGKHTTVATIMLPLPGGGYIVDSPGVRDYAPAIAEAADVAAGFPEIRSTAEQCRFANCRHRREPGCAVKAAVDEGRVAARRFESYRRLLNLTEQQQPY